MSDPIVKLDRLATNPFLDGPCGFIAKTVALKISEVPQFKLIFADSIDAYMRVDYPLSALPAIRVYDRGFTKESDDGWINGELFLDVIWPPSLRRSDLQHLPDTMSAALLQQFRRNTFFNDVENETGKTDPDRFGYNLLGVPGLNQLGKRFTVDKSLGFQLTAEETAPLTQIRVNFRVDLRIWDDYLEDNLRTKEDPFEQTLAELSSIMGQVVALRDDGTEELSMETDFTGLDED